jgi:DNA-binding XRE family transcriptional regulator
MKVFKNGYFSPWTDNPRRRIIVGVAKRPSDLVELGNRIRAARKASQMTQEDLAYESDIDRSYIGGVERGERNVTFTILCKIAKALKSDVASLTEGLPAKRP